MVHRAMWLLAAVTACLAVSASAQCNLTVQDVPLYLTSCPGDNYTATILYYNSGNMACNVAAETTLSAGVGNLTFGTPGNGRAQSDSPSDVSGISLNPIPAGTSVILTYIGTVLASAAGTNITSVATGTPVGGALQMATATTQVLTFAQCGSANPPPAPPSPGPPPPTPSPPAPPPPSPPAPEVVTVLKPKPHAAPHPAPHPKPHPKPTPPPQETSITLAAAQRGAVTASSVLGCLHLKSLAAGQEVVIVIKPELHPNGSVKMNPNSLVRSSLELNGIAARKAANGAAISNYRPSTYTLAVAFPSTVRKFKTQHSVVLTGRYKVSEYKTAAFKSKPIPVC